MDRRGFLGGLGASFYIPIAMPNGGIREAVISDFWIFTDEGNILSQDPNTGLWVKLPGKAKKK